jgi:hypothetical protein
MKLFDEFIASTGAREVLTGKAGAERIQGYLLML